METKWSKFLYYLVKPIYIILLPILYRPKILNKNKIPESGPIIIAGNHIHAADPINVLVSTNRVVHYMAKEELFKGFHGLIFKAIGLIPVYKNKGNALAVIEAERILNSGGVVGIFPEGTRNKIKNTLLPFRHGAVTIAQKTNCKIVPFAISGEYKLFGKGPIVEFGDPIDVSKMDNKEANELLRNTVLKMIEKKGEL